MVQRIVSVTLLLACVLSMMLCAGCALLSGTDDGQPDGYESLEDVTDENRRVEYVDSEMQRVRIQPVLSPEDASNISDSQALELLGLLYRSYAIVDAWYMNPPGNLIVDENADPHNGTYYPVENLTYQQFKMALYCVFGGDIYLPEVYDRQLFMDVDGTLYINTSSEGQVYSCLPDINEPAILERTSMTITYEVPVVESHNVVVGSVIIVATRGRDLWTFATDVFRDIYMI